MLKWVMKKIKKLIKMILNYGIDNNKNKKKIVT
jgi:hypothetical protein